MSITYDGSAIQFILVKDIVVNFWPSAMRFSSFSFLCFQIAMGVPLHRIKDIRVLYGESPWADSSINFESPSSVPVPRGHVIAARITSENPDEVRRMCPCGHAGTMPCM